MSHLLKATTLKRNQASKNQPLAILFYRISFTALYITFGLPNV